MIMVVLFKVVVVVLVIGIVGLVLVHVVVLVLDVGASTRGGVGGTSGGFDKR
jgi:hypothetical protein